MEEIKPSNKTFSRSLKEFMDSPEGKKMLEEEEEMGEFEMEELVEEEEEE